MDLCLHCLILLLPLSKKQLETFGIFIAAANKSTYITPHLHVLLPLMLLLLHNLDNKSVSATLSDELLIIILGPFFSFPLPPLLVYLSTVVPAELLLWLSLLVYSANQPSKPRGLRIQTSTASGYSRVRLASCCSSTFRLYLSPWPFFLRSCCFPAEHVPSFRDHRLLCSGRVSCGSSHSRPSLENTIKNPIMFVSHLRATMKRITDKWFNIRWWVTFLSP